MPVSIPPSLGKYLPDDHYLDEWRMRSMDPGRPLVIVEGATDRKLFKTLFKRSTKVEYPRYDPDDVDSNNKKTVIASISKLNDWKASAVVGIVDADYDRVLAKILKLPNLFYTDEHDMEMQIVKSEAFRKFLTHSIQNLRFKRFWKNRGKNNEDWLDLSRDLIVYLAFEIGLYRMAVFETDPQIDFPQICNQVCDSHMELNSEFLLGLLRDNGVDMDDLKLTLRDLRSKINPREAYQVARGHDAAALTATALGHAFAKRIITPTEVESQLRMSYEMLHFMESMLYENLEKWASSNEISLF